MLIRRVARHDSANQLPQHFTHKTVSFAEPAGKENDDDSLMAHEGLLNRAIIMHLLREGQFEVASLLAEESRADTISESSTSDVRLPSAMNAALPNQFREMYAILAEIKARNLEPAIDWTRRHGDELFRRGSKLEFDLIRLQYMWIFQGEQSYGSHTDGPVAAMSYGRSNFGRYSKRYSAEIQRLCSAVAYRENIPGSPYGGFFDTSSAFADVEHAFTRDFCFVLGLPADSPLYVAFTAGAISLPKMEKHAQIMRDAKVEWTTSNELGVELPLPESMNFHQIFVCPVSKEQATDDNPPMRLQCGHVLARESIAKVSKQRQIIRCPYCPRESNVKDAKQIYL